MSARPRPTTPTELLPLVGLEVAAAEAEAKQAGYRVRTARLDGKAQIVTQDYRTDRINLHVEAGRVVAAYLG
jgi:hypothetical protein